MEAIQRSDVKIPSGIDLDKGHQETIVGVITLVVSEYSISAQYTGEIPSPSDAAKMIERLSSSGEYSKEFKKQ